MIQVLRRLFLVIIWLNIIIFGGMTSFYAVTITRVTDDLSSVAAVIPLAIGASIIIVFLLVGYIFHRITNYIFGLPPKTNP
jgi:hypothetical protein